MRAAAVLPGGYVQPRTPGHPSVGGSPVLVDFAGESDPGRAYELAWRIWRAQTQDCRLTLAEVDARAAVIAELRLS